MIPMCKVCPRQCGVIREDTVFSDGVCGMPAFPRVARAALHFGEEPCISGKNGSGTVFFSGCTLSCVFCQNSEISHKKYGETVSPARLAEIFKELEQKGAHNINLVNPTHFVDGIKAALDIYKPHIPIVYNTSGYERAETIQSLNGYIDIYLPDLKYVSEDLAKRISGVSNYFAYASAAILEMVKQTGIPVFDDAGIMQTGTMVRHLVLPSHTKESMAVLDWLAQYKDILFVSTMFQYTPLGNLDSFPDLQRCLTKRECDKIWDYVQARGITNGYIQDKNSSGADMIPQFDLTGVFSNESI